MSIIKLALWLFVAIIVITALFMAYKDIAKHIPQEKKKVETFREPDVKICLFYATWCGHCHKYLDSKIFMSTYDELKKQSGFDKVVFVQIDGDKSKDLTEKYNISSFPTIVAISADGDLINEFSGDRNDKDALKEFAKVCLSKV